MDLRKYVSLFVEMILFKYVRRLTGMSQFRCSLLFNGLKQLMM